MRQTDKAPRQKAFCYRVDRDENVIRAWRAEEDRRVPSDKPACKESGEKNG
jgi:hypothetical protein